ncbi:DUF6397 family protein [Streptomyces sp. NPDC002309]
MSGNTIASTQVLTRSPSRAARELGLKRREFELAVNLGRIRTLPDEGGGGRRVADAEIERLRSQEGFPAPLLERVRTVSTNEAARLMGVTGGRFTRLARLGLVAPVAFCLNRYRALVWLYLADEVSRFAADEQNARVVRGRVLPEELLVRLRDGTDLRARNWRGRHLGFLLRRADSPWERAGALAALLEPVHVAEVVEDSSERALVNRFRPGPPTHGAPDSPSALLAEKLMTADEPDEIGWLRAELAQVLDEARAQRPAFRQPHGHGDTGRTAHPDDSARTNRVGHAAGSAHAHHVVGAAGPAHPHRPVRGQGAGHSGRLPVTRPPTHGSTRRSAPRTEAQTRAPQPERPRSLLSRLLRRGR